MRYIIVLFIIACAAGCKSKPAVELVSNDALPAAVTPVDAPADATPAVEVVP